MPKTKTIKTPQVVTDIETMLTDVAGFTLLRREWQVFEGEGNQKLFNAIWNRQYSYDCDEELTKKIIRTAIHGKKIFGVSVLQEDDAYYAVKQTPKKTVYMKFKLYIR